MKRTKSGFILSPTLLITLLLVLAIGGGTYAYQYTQNKVSISAQPTPQKNTLSQTTAPTVPATPTPTQSTGITLEQLRNTTYSYYNTNFTLQNGQFTRARSNNVSDGLELFSVVASSYVVGSQDAVIVINHGFGANRLVPVLFVFSSNNGQPKQVAYTELADHTQITSAAIDKQSITLTVVSVGPNDNYHNPTLHEFLTYTLQGDVLTKVTNQTKGKYSDNGIHFKYPTNWSFKQEDSERVSLISDNYKQQLTQAPKSAYVGGPTADIYVTYTAAPTGKTVTQDAESGGLNSNITEITVGGQGAIAGTRAGMVSSYVVYVLHNSTLYTIEFALHETGNQLTQDEHSILDSIGFN